MGLNFPWKKPPFEHQPIIADWHYKNLNSLDLSDVGVGKTAPLITVLNTLVAAGKLTRILVIAPNSILDNWAKELEQWSDLTYVILRGTKEQRINLLANCLGPKDINWPVASVFLINFEGVRTVYPLLNDPNKPWDLIICDEIHHIKEHRGGKNTPTQSWYIRQLGKRAKARKGLTGTIITNDLMDVWAIAEFIDPNIFKCNSWGFRHRFLTDQNDVTCRVENRMDNPYVKIFFNGIVALEIELELENAGFQFEGIKVANLGCWQAERTAKTIEVGEDFRKRNYLKFPKLIPKIGAVEEVQRLLAPYAIRFEKREVLKFLPPVLFERRMVELSTEQRKVYNDLKKHFVAELDKEPFAALQILERINKLQQIASGFIYRPDEPTYHFKSNAKLDELKAVLEEIGDKRVLIWTAFREDIQLITASFQKWFADDFSKIWSVIDGSVEVAERQLIVDQFNNRTQYLIANAATAGEGLTILAPYVIYYSRSFKLGERLQSLGRSDRPGAEAFENITVIDLVCSQTVDTAVMEALEKKEDLLKTLNPKTARDILNG